MTNTLVKAEDGASDNSIRLTKLLSDSSVRKRCIDLVEEHFVDIIEARRRKITWDAIAETLNMNRGTLINAVKTLTAQGNISTKLVLPTITQKPASSHSRVTNNEVMPYPPPTSSLIKDATYPNVGMTTLGRTKIENFNL